MLTYVASWNDHFRFRDIVVLQKDDFQEVANILVLVDDGTNVVDEMDDSFRHPVSRSGFATKDRHSGCELLTLFRRHFLDRQISVNDTENVHLLALILVYTLDLDVEQSSRIHCHTSGCLDMLSKADLVSILDLLPLLLELFIICI